MDPVTAIGLAAGVQQLLKSLISYGQDVKNAKGEIRQLSLEVTMLKAALENVKTVAESSREITEHYHETDSVLVTLNMATKEAAEMIKSTESLLEELLDVLVQKSTGNRPLQELKKVWQITKWPLRKKQARDYIARIERAKNWFTLALTTDDTIQCREMYSKICDIEQTLRKQGAYQASRELDEARSRIISWLAPYESHGNYRKSLDYFQDGTGEWFLTGALLNWSNGKTAPLLWLRAKPGSGKTTLMAAAIRKLQTDQIPGRKLAIAYSFCSLAEQRSQDLSAILASLVAQLCDHDQSLWELVDHHPALGRAGKSLHDKPKIEDLMGLLIQISEQIGPVHFMVDAVNEAKEPGRIVDCFEALLGRSKLIRILISSTVETALGRSTSNQAEGKDTIAFVHFPIDAVSADIKTYIEAELEKRWKLRQLSRSLKLEILSALLEKSEGVFRWVQCQLDHLTDGRRTRTIQDIRIALKNLPLSLEQTYEQILMRVKEDDIADLIKPFLFWLCFSRRSMSLAEICEALVIPDDGGEIGPESRLQWPHELLRACGSLTTSASTSLGAHLMLAHSSVSEFLTSERLKAGPMGTFHLEPRTADSTISKLCLNYLLCSEFQSGYCVTDEAFANRMHKSPLLAYIRDTLWDHLYFVDPHGPLGFLILRFVNSQYLPRRGNFGAWLQVFNPSTAFHSIEETTVLYWAAREGLLPLVKLILAVEGNQNLEKKGGVFGSTPLHVASWTGEVAVVKELLAAGADVKEQNYDGKNGLFWAIAEGHKEIEQLLREAGAELDEHMENLVRASHDNPNAMYHVSDDSILDWNGLTVESEGRIKLGDETTPSVNGTQFVREYYLSNLPAPENPES